MLRTDLKNITRTSLATAFGLLLFLVSEGQVINQPTGRLISWDDVHRQPTVDTHLYQNLSGFASSEEYDLRPDFVATSATGTHIRYWQYHKGIPVWDSYRIVHLLTDGKSLVTNNLKDVLTESRRVPDTLNPNTVWYPSNGKFTLCNMVLDSIHSSSFHLNLVTLEGEIMSSMEANLHHSQDTTLRALVHMPNPIVSANVTYGKSFSDHSNSTNSLLNRELYEVYFKAKKLSAGIKLESDLLYFTNISSPRVPANPFSDTLPLVDRSDYRFELINSYYHLRKYQDRIRKMGFENLLTKLQVDPHALGGEDQSQFSPYRTPNSLEFGVGGVDDAEDAQVLIHELAHSLSHQASPFTNEGIERKSMEEGNADYLAMSYSQSLNANTGYDVFSWDGHNEYWDGYSINSSKKYPDDMQGTTNADREIWSSALMCIHDKLGRKKTDSLVLEHLYYQSSNSTMPMMANYLLSLDTLLFQGNHYNEIKNCFIEQGILRFDERDVNGNSDGMNSVFNSREFALGSNALVVWFSVTADYRYEVVDNHGRVVYISSENHSNSIKISPQDIPRGVYYLRIFKGAGHLPVLRTKIVRF